MAFRPKRGKTLRRPAPLFGGWQKEGAWNSALCFPTSARLPANRWSSGFRLWPRRADGLGYHSVWVGDHVVFPAQLQSKYPYHPEGRFPVDSNDNFLDPLTVLSYVAACTTTVRLGTGVLIVPYRNPVVTAKMVASMDVLSHGRVILGGGSGWLREEFEVLHAPYRQRGDQTDEYLQVMKALWTQDQARFDGRYEKFSDIVCAPKPVQKPHPPIWIGGHSKRALRRTATLGDGWYGHVFWRDPDGFAQRYCGHQTAGRAGRPRPRLADLCRAVLRTQLRGRVGRFAAL